MMQIGSEQFSVGQSCIAQRPVSTSTAVVCASAGIDRIPSVSREKGFVLAILLTFCG